MSVLVPFASHAYVAVCLHLSPFQRVGVLDRGPLVLGVRCFFRRLLAVRRTSRNGQKRDLVGTARSLPSDKLGGAWLCDRSLPQCSCACTAFKLLVVGDGTVRAKRVGAGDGC